MGWLTRTALHVLLAAASTEASAPAMLAPRQNGSTTDAMLRFQTWNLRFDSMPDNITVAESLAALPPAFPPDTGFQYYNFTGEAPWSTRRLGVAREVLFNRPDMLAVQEALVRQVTDLEELLGPGYARIGVGRDDGVAAGEFEAIYYKTDVVQLLDWDTFWLSPTPFEPSIFPGAGSIRTATRGQFQSVAGTFTFICTHWDDQSDDQRKLGASLIRYRGAFEAARTGRPVFTLGDFNSPSDGPSSGGYQIMTGEADLVPINQTFADMYKVGNGTNADFVFEDVTGQMPPFNRSGDHSTFTGFVPPGDTEDYQRIDFVMGGSNGGWVSNTYRVGDTLYDDFPRISDHRPVWVDMTVKA